MRSPLEKVNKQQLIIAIKRNPPDEAWISIGLRELAGESGRCDHCHKDESRVKTPTPKGYRKYFDLEARAFLSSTEGMPDKIKIGNIGSVIGSSETKPCKPESKAAAANKDKEKIKRKADRKTLRVQDKNRSKEARLR